MRVIRPLVMLAMVSGLVACSGAPGESQLEHLLQQQFDQKYQDLIDVNDLTKHNGWADSEQYYTAEVTYNIEFKQSFKAYLDQQTAKPGNPLEKVATGMSAGLLKLQYGDFNAGDTYQVKQQTLNLRKTENGWALVN